MSSLLKTSRICWKILYAVRMCFNYELTCSKYCLHFYCYQNLILFLNQLFIYSLKKNIIISLILLWLDTFNMVSPQGDVSVLMPRIRSISFCWILWNLFNTDRSRLPQSYDFNIARFQSNVKNKSLPQTYTETIVSWDDLRRQTRKETNIAL